MERSGGSLSPPREKSRSNAVLSARLSEQDLPLPPAGPFTLPGPGPLPKRRGLCAGQGLPMARAPGINKNYLSNYLSNK